MKYRCPVCHHMMDHPPADWNICGGCGTEFNLDDEHVTHEELREAWIQGGRKWWSDCQQPVVWPPL